jgi:hypothetical protein
MTSLARLSLISMDWSGMSSLKTWSGLRIASRASWRDRWVDAQALSSRRGMLPSKRSSTESESSRREMRALTGRSRRLITGGSTATKTSGRSGYIIGGRYVAEMRNEENREQPHIDTMVRHMIE